MPHVADRLTGLPGRDLLDDLRAGFSAHPVHEAWTIAMIDIDQFKLINDAYGHLLGDLVLSEVGAALRKNARTGDCVLRYGGDEFLAAFPSTQVQGATAFARRVMEAAASMVLPHDLHITFSIGMAERLPGDTNLDQVIQRADSALYQAKHEGRNRFVLYDQKGSQRRDELAFTHFVGRERELRILRQVLDETLEHGSRCAVVSGEAGVGKTRLTEEIARYGAFRGCLVERAACSEFGESTPYSFFTAPIQGFLSALREHDVVQIRHFVGPIHPASSALLPGFDTADQGQRFFTDEALKFRVFEDMLRVMRAITMLQPALLVLEDAQWMARHDLDLLAYLVRASGDAPLLTVVTLRQDGDEASGSSQFVTGLAQATSSPVLTLTNLEADEVATLLTLTLRDSAMPFEVMGLLHRQSGGNPFFLLELLRALRDEGQIAPLSQGGWAYYIDREPVAPASLAQVVSRRLESLSESCMKLIRTASLATGPFSLELLVEVTGRPEMEVAEGLEEALRAGVIRETGSSFGPAYAFVHDTVRSFIYRDLSQATRAVTHPRMGEFYERLYRDGRDDLVGATAHHYAQGDDQVKTRTYALLAAKASAQRHAARETIRWLRVYVESASEETEPRGDLIYAYRSLGEFSSLIGDGESAQRYLDVALQLCELDQDRASVLSRIGENFQKLSRYPQARDHYVQALALTTDPVARADLLISLVYVDCLQGLFADAATRLDEARALLGSVAQSAETQRVWAAYHKRMGDVRHEIAGPSEALPHYQTSLEHYREQGDRVGESAVLNNMSSCFSTLGDHERSLELLHDAARINAQIDDALGLAIAHYNLAEGYGALNQVGLAREYYERYMTASARIGNELAMGYGHVGLGYLAWLEGDLRASETSYRESIEAFVRLQTAQLATVSRLRLAEVLLEQGKLAEGGDELRRMRDSLGPDPDPSLELDLLFLEGLYLLLTGHLGSNPEMIPRMADALTKSRDVDLRNLIRYARVLARAYEDQGNGDAARQTLRRALGMLGDHLSRISNHAYRDSLAHAREMREIREDYLRMTGTKWQPP